MKLMGIPGYFCILLTAVGCDREVSFKSRQAQYLPVIEWVRNSGIFVATNEFVNLPSDIHGASVDGQVYITFHTTNHFAIAFKTWRGKGQNMEGFLYTQQPLKPDDILKDMTGNPTFTIGPIELLLERKLDAHWYRVSHRLD